MDEEPKKSVVECLEALEKRLEELEKQTGEAGNYAYRGQEDASWPVESAATRRLRNDDMENFSFVRYHEKVILEPARMDGHGVIGGQKLSDLELLANLQHYGAATCLIDFTRNFFVALWFACKGAGTRDGKVFILNTKDREVFCFPNKDDLECSIRELLEFKKRIREKKDEKEPETFLPLYWSWAPHDINQRILKQDSFFIFGKKEIKKGYLEEILISGESKLDILKELEKLGIREGSLFKDPPGFASLHGAEVPLPPEYKGTIKTVVDDVPASDEATTYFQLGNEAFQQGKHQIAVQRYNQAIRLNPNYADVHYNRGDANFILGNHAEAIEDYSRAIDLRPDDALAYHNRASAKIFAGEYEKAIEDYNQAIRYKSDYARAYYNRGIAKAKLSKYPEAIEDYDQAIRLESDFAPAYYNRGVSKGKLDRYQEAIEDYDQAIRLEPDDVLAYNNRGVAKAELDKYSEAIEDYNQAIKLAPKDMPAYQNRGNARVKLKQYPEAIEDYNRVVQLQPHQAFAYCSQAEAKLKLDDKDGARQDFLRAKELAEAQANKELLKEINQHLSKLDGEGTDK